MIEHGSALIVDDARFMRAVIRDALEALFHDIRDASTQEEVEYQLRDWEPQLVTLDLTLDPTESVQGLSVLGEIRERSPDSIIIVISALQQEWLCQKLMREGATEYLPKPFEKKTLQKLVWNVLTT